MKIPEGPVRDILTEYIDFRDTRPVDDKQRSLTDEFLMPDIEAIAKELSVLRKGFDARIKETLDRMLASAPPQYEYDPAVVNPRKYPLGFCGQITDGVFVEMLKGMEFPSTLTMRVFEQFKKRGGHLKRIGGIQHGMYFQNAIQAGSLFVDVANDTVDKSKPSVCISDLEKSRFKNLESFGEYAGICEQYLQERIFPQKIFPFLTPLYPFMAVRELGRVEILPASLGLRAKNILSDFQMAEDAVFVGNFSDGKLPAQLHGKIGEHFGWDEDHYDFDVGTARGDIFYRGGAPNDLLREIFERARNIDPVALPGLMSGSHIAIEKFNRLKIRV